MKNSLILCLILSLTFVLNAFPLQAAGAKGSSVNEKATLLKLDKEIAKMAAKKGILEAFVSVAVDDTVLFPLFGFPVDGKEACQKLLEKKELKGHSFTWEPVFSDVSKSGDLGYTWGKYKRPAKEAKEAKETKATKETAEKKKKPEDSYGYYGTIWRKQADGSWKVVVSQGLIGLKDLNGKRLPSKIIRSKADEITLQVFDAERAFSMHSVKKGIVQAFHHYLDDSGVALSQDGPPRTKKDYAKALESLKENPPKGESRLFWNPFYSFVSSSGDLAYNYGPYTYSMTSPDGRTKIKYGYFVTVWKKQKDNTWKFVFDGGNESLNHEKPPRGRD